MPVPIVYRRASDNIVATYDSTEIASGTGYVKFYAAEMSKMSGATVVSGQTLISTPIYTDFEETGRFNLTATDVEVVSKSWDVLFNLSRVVNGNVYIACPVGVTGAPTARFVISLYKVTAGTPTFLISGQTLSHTHGINIPWLYAISLPLTNIKFKKGDSFRAKMDLWAKEASTSIEWAYSPMNLDTSGHFTIDTMTQVLVPFKVDA